MPNHYEVEDKLRGYIARLENLDALVQTNRHNLLSCHVSRYSSRAHFFIGKAKWYLGRPSFSFMPEYYLAQFQRFVPAIDVLEGDIKGSLARSEQTLARKAEIAAKLQALKSDTLDELFENARVALSEHRRAA